jgi:serine/threonine-protein kinase RsbW
LENGIQVTRQVGRAFFAAKLENLGVIRSFAERTAQSLHANQTAIDEMIQAVDEAVTNIIVHGYAGQPGMVELVMQREGDMLVARLRDQAPHFDPTTVPPPDLTLPLEKRPLGGLGVYLTRKFVDQMYYRAMPQGGNELTLVKKAFP